jgi:hypothetical protein
MREYEPKYPLEILDTFFYLNLLRDSNGRVLSENITWFVSAEVRDSTEILAEVESQVKKSCQGAEVAYHDSCGNRWIFLVLNGNQNRRNLGQMQAVYKKLYRKMSSQRR